MFNVHIDAHPLVINPRRVDEHIVSNDIPEAVEYMNEPPIEKDTHANSGVHTTLRFRMRCRTSVQ